LPAPTGNLLSSRDARAGRAWRSALGMTVRASGMTQRIGHDGTRIGHDAAHRA